MASLIHLGHARVLSNANLHLEEREKQAWMYNGGVNDLLKLHLGPLVNFGV
jgi:hypothetical protein